MKHEIFKFHFEQSLDASDHLKLYIYSEVAPDGRDWWTGKVTKSETSADFFREELAKYPNVKHIDLYINSAGGSVKEGYGIYSQLKRCEAEITVHVDGFANSIASIIAMAGDRIIMMEGSVMGIHNMMDYCFGNASEHRKVAESLDKLMEGNRQIYLRRANGKLTEEKLTEMLDAETYLTAKECLAYGLCDEITGKVSDPQGVTEKMQHMSADFAAQVKYFADLKQQLSAALDAITSVGAPAPADPEPAPADPEPAPADPEPKDPTPEEKTVSTFLSALSALKGE